MNYLLLTFSLSAIFGIFIVSKENLDQIKCAHRAEQLKIHAKLNSLSHTRSLALSKCSMTTKVQLNIKGNVTND